MSFPIFPATLTWNTPYRDRERVSMARYQAGVEQVERVGINRRSQSIDVNIRIQNAAEIQTFLKERRGRPFRLRVDSRLLGEDLLYSCDEWQMPERGKNLWEFSATFNQERRFEPKITQYLSLTAETLNVNAGQTIVLTAGLSGFSEMPGLNWSIVYGPGSIIVGPANLATYSPGLNPYSDEVAIRVRISGTTLEATLSLIISENAGVLSVTINPASIDLDANIYSSLDMAASVNAVGSAANAVVWSVRSGTAVLDESTAVRTNLLMPYIDQTLVVRATAIADSSKWAESVITVRKPALISGINVSASPSSILPGGVAQLSATVLGVGVFDPSVTWSIVSGGGTLNGTQYTAGPNIGSAVLEAVSVANSLIRQPVTIAIATSVTSTITSVSASASPNPVSNGSTTQISAVVLGTDSFDSSVTWVVVSGPGIIVGNVLTATGVGTIIAKATSIQDGTKNGSVSIVSTATIQNGVTGITGTATPSTIYVGQTSNIDVIVTGIGTFSTATNWIGPGLNIVGTGNSRIFTAASFPNTSFLQVVSIERPSIFVDIQIVTVLPSIISVTASALSNSIPNGSTTQVSAVVSGDGPFDPAVTWTIFSGPGTIAGDIVTATGVGTIVVKATSVQDVSKSATVSIVATATATNNTLIVNDVAWTSILEDDIYTVVRPASVTGPIYSVSLINNIQSALFQKYGLNLTYDSFFVDALIYYFFYE